MSIKFTVHERVHTRDKDAPRKFYPLAEISTLNNVGVLAALALLVRVIKEQLAKGNIICVGDFSAVIISLNGTGSIKKEDVMGSNCSYAQLRFMPGKVFSNMLPAFINEKVSVSLPFKI